MTAGISDLAVEGDGRRGGRLGQWRGWVFGFGVLVLLAFGVDGHLAAWFKGPETPWAKVLAECISRVGDFPVLMGLGLSGMAVFWRMGHPRVFRVVRLMVLAGMVAGVVANGGRYLTGRARPVAKVAPGWYGPRAALRPEGAHKFQSFPSAHTSCLAGFLFPLVMLWRRRRMRWAAVLALALILAMGWSRMHHRVHHLSDVLAGLWVGSISGLWVCGLRARGGLGGPCAAGGARVVPRGN